VLDKESEIKRGEPGILVTILNFLSSPGEMCQKLSTCGKKRRMKSG